MILILVDCLDADRADRRDMRPEWLQTAVEIDDAFDDQLFQDHGDPARETRGRELSPRLVGTVEVAPCHVLEMQGAGEVKDAGGDPKNVGVADLIKNTLLLGDVDLVTPGEGAMDEAQAGRVPQL